MGLRRRWARPPKPEPEPEPKQPRAPRPRETVDFNDLVFWFTKHGVDSLDAAPLAAAFLVDFAVQRKVKAL